MATVQTQHPPLQRETRFSRTPDPSRRSSFPIEQGSAEREDRGQRRTSLNSRPQLLALGTPAAKEASKSFWTSEMLQRQLDKVVQCAEREHRDRLTLTSQTSLNSSVDSGAVSPKLPLHVPLIGTTAHARASRSAPPTPPATERGRTLLRPLTRLSPPARLGSPSLPPAFSVARRTGSLQSVVHVSNSIGYLERITPPFLSPRLVRRAHTACVRAPLAPTLSVEGKRAKVSPKMVSLRKSNSLNFSPKPVVARRDNRMIVLGRQESGEDDGFCEL